MVVSAVKWYPLIINRAQQQEFRAVVLLELNSFLPVVIEPSLGLIKEPT